MNNVGKVAAHLFMQIFSSCSVLVRDSDFTYANRITEDDPMELGSVIYPSEVVFLYINDGYDDTATIDASIIMNEVHIAENFGGGLSVPILPHFPQSFIQLRLKKVAVVYNFLVRKVYVVQFEQLMTNIGGNAYTSLESVKISDNVLVIQNENTWNSKFGIGALSTINSEVNFKQTEIFNNNIPAVYSYISDMHFHGVNVFRNNTGRQCGGALVLRVNSHIYLHRGDQVYILENKALKYGGGICVDSGSVSELLWYASIK